MKRPGTKATRNFLRGLLWLDVLYPIALILLIAMGLTKLLYTGTLNATLAAKADFELIDRALRLTTASLHAVKNQLKIVDIDDTAVLTRPHREREGQLDLLPEDYGAALLKILAQKPKLVVLRLIPALEAQTKDAYLSLRAALKSAPNSDTVIIAYPQNGQFKAPAEALAPFATLVDDDLCMHGVLLCPYVKEWNDWIVQVLINRISLLTLNEPPAQALTRYFPIRFPTFMVAGAALNQEDRISITPILEGRIAAGFFTNQIVFIGRTIRQPKEDLSIKTAYTVFDEPLKSDAQSGQTPLHEFWAQVANLALSNSYVSFANFTQVLIATVLSCLAVIGAFLFFKVTTAQLATVLWLLALYFIDILCLAWFRVYVPLFSVIYFSLITFMFMNFGRLSYEAFNRWLASERSQRLARTADLRGNFISLISHNLNTPIAKMQGMLNILIPNLKSNATIPAAWLSALQLKVATTEAVIRATLMLTSLEEEHRTLKSLSLSNILDEFRYGMGATLKRGGVKVKIHEEISDHELAMSPMMIDAKALSAALSALMWLCQSQSNTALSWQVTIRVYENADPTLCLQLSITLSPKQAAFIGPLVLDSTQDLAASAFVIEVMHKVLHKAVFRLGAKIYVASDPQPELMLRLTSQI